MSQNSRNPNPVAFLEDTRQLSFNRESAYGERRPHIVPLGYIPPFQIVRPLTSASTIVFSLYRYETDTEIYITFYMYQTGFQVWNFPTYKIWLYPGTIPLPLPSLNEGVYRMTITTGGGGDILTREDFCWKHESGMSGFVKMEWFHQRSLELPFGKVIFEPPFKYWHWFQTELGKPTYPVERDVDVRKGVEYVNMIVSWKEQRFVTRGDENFMDAMSLVQHMDTVVVTFLGDEINAFRVIVTPDWQERGDEALIEIEIRSDQVIATNGDALDDFDYDIEQSQCLPTELIAVAILDYLSTPYNLGLYQTPIGETVYLMAGQFVLIKNGATIGYYSFISPGNYLFISIATDLVVYESNSGTYYVNDSVLTVTKPTITDIDNSSPTAYVVTGVGLPGTFIEIFGRVDSSSSDEVLLAVGTNTEFGAGITFDPLGMKSFRVKCSTSKCQHFAISTWKTNLSGGGIGEGLVGDTFEVG